MYTSKRMLDYGENKKNVKLNHEYTINEFTI
jgi:hypothetical protein